MRKGACPVATSPEMLMLPAGIEPWMGRVESFGRGRGWRAGPGEGGGQDLATRNRSRKVRSQKREGGFSTSSLLWARLSEG